MSIHALSNPLLHIYASMPEALQKQIGQGSPLPQRCFQRKPEDNGTFILPLKQSFIKDARLMPGTRCMLALLAGWAGRGVAIELTQGTISKHIGRSVRQVYRYLQDARREGYLRYCYTKNRLGMITGLKVWLTFDLIRSVWQKNTKTPGKQGQTHRSEINKNHRYRDKKDPELDLKLQRLQQLIE